MSLVRKRVVARGRVQGVFFRDSVRRRAEGLGVSGWVRNRDDGAVEAVVEGEPGGVEALVAYCREGPGRAEVSSLEVSDEPPGSCEGFQVR